MTQLRIQKVLSETGVASRRQVEEMILQGRISVNGKLVVALPCFVDLAVDKINVDGQPIRIHQAAKLYYLLNKPRGVVCSKRPSKRLPSVFDLVPPAGGQELRCVGPLISTDTGVVLLTSDGELAQRLTHPGARLEKTYEIDVRGELTGDKIERLKRGIVVGRWRSPPARVKVIKRGPERTVLEMTLAEGHEGDVHGLLESIGHPVRKLKRVALGPVSDPKLEIGYYRKLHPKEIAKLTDACAVTREFRRRGR